jgi:hypothetical protein
MHDLNWQPFCTTAAAEAVMRRLLFVLSCGALLAGAVAPAAAQEQRDDDRVCFYRDVEYQGEAWCYRAGDELADLRNRRNEISSLRIFGRARVTVFDEREFLGAADEFDRDVPDLSLRNMEGRRTWNDRIESFRITTDRGGRFGGLFGNRGRGDGRDDDRRDRRATRDRICVYDRPNYAGRSQCWDAGAEEENLNRTNGWNDRIASIRVFGRTSVEVYREAGFRGQRLRIDRDVADLGALNWGSQISSFRVRD